MRSLFRLGATFFIELLYLIWQFNKSIFWTAFYFLFPPTEKYVRNEIVLITGSSKGLGKLNKNCLIKVLNFYFLTRSTISNRIC